MCAAVAAILAGCAATPESIAPAYVSEVTYQNWSCQQLSEETMRLNAAYQVAAQEQHHARTNDTVGVLLLGLPVASLSGGNVAPQVASLKGNQAAVERAMTLKNCRNAAEVQPAVYQTPGPAPVAAAAAAQKQPTAAPAAKGKGCVRVVTDPSQTVC
jgi:hypothetical protein